MGDWIINLTGLLFLFAIVAIFKWHELAKTKQLKNLVEWSVTGGYCPAAGINSYDRELWVALLITQHKLNISREYRINEKEDFDNCHEIIKEYQADISRKYFLGELTLIKSKYAVSGEDYFMAAFYEFLSKRQCYNEVVGHTMHEERLEYKHYGQWGGELYDATYLLSDFGLMYHKLLYITFCYLKNSKIFNPENKVDWQEQRESGIKKVLDTKQLAVSCF